MEFQALHTQSTFAGEKWQFVIRRERAAPDAPWPAWTLETSQKKGSTVIFSGEGRLHITAEGSS